MRLAAAASALAGTVAHLTGAGAVADVADRPYPVTETREPCEGYDPLRGPHFGDTHVHTTYSFDANIQDTRNTPRDAYRFARGERMGIQPYDEDGKPLRHVQLGRPLDFTVVTDHSELLAEVTVCATPGVPGYESLLCRIYRGYPSFSFKLVATRTLVGKQRFGICSGKNAAYCEGKAAGVWLSIQNDHQPVIQERAWTSPIWYEPVRLGVAAMETSP